MESPDLESSVFEMIDFHSSDDEATEGAAEGIKAAMSLDSFTCFPRLPIELRLRIWNLVLPGPRFIVIARDGDGSKTIRVDQIEELVWRVKSSSRSPTLLFVNREARKESLKSYKPLICNLQHDYDAPLRTSRHPLALAAAEMDAQRRLALYARIQQADVKLSKPVVYCDFGRDVIFIKAVGKHNFLDQLRKEDRDSIAFVAVPDLVFIKGETASFKFTELPGLKELMVVRNTFEMSRLLVHAGLRRELNSVWQLCQGFHDEADFSIGFPTGNKQVEETIRSHRATFSTGKGVVARPGYFVTDNGVPLSSWRKIFGEDWSLEQANPDQPSRSLVEELRSGNP